MQNGQSLLLMSLEEFLCRHATQFFAASFGKPGLFVEGIETIQVGIPLDV
jgi:hypothetical protein